MKHTLSVLVENHFGVLSRVSSLFSMRGYNIDSLCVGVTENPAISRMTVVVEGDEGVLGQIINQLNKVVEVIEVLDLTATEFVERELVFVKVGTQSPEARSQVFEIANVFKAKVSDLGEGAVTAEVTGNSGKVAAFIEMMRPFGIMELVRSGKIAISRAPKSVEVEGE